MGDEAKVDFRHVIDAFNQSGYFHFKFCREGANFSNVRLNLADVMWSNNTLEAPQSEGFSRKVEVSTRRDVNTTVTAIPDATPGSTVTLTTGAVLGVGNPKVDAELQMPPQFSSYLPLIIDLKKDSQRVFLPEESKQKKQLRMRGAGNVSVKSENVIYQGYFQAVAELRGTVIFNTQGTGRQQAAIEELARQAHNRLPKYFKYQNGALTWTVTGTADFLLENISIVKGY